MRGLPLFLVLLTACGGGPVPVPPRPVPFPADSKAPAPARHRIVAWLNDRPITRDTLLDATLQMDYRGTVDRYVMRVLMDERKKALGIKNTREQLLARARARVERLKGSAGEERFRKQLEQAGLSEAEFIDQWARQPSLDVLLANEKAVVHELLSTGYARIDLAVLNSIDEADAYHRDPKAVKPREVIRDLRITRTMAPAMMRGDLVEQVMAVDKTPKAVRAALRGGSGAVHVTVRERVEAVEPSAEQIFENVVRRPPDPHELEMWVRSLFTGAEVKYDDRWDPAGN